MIVGHVSRGRESAATSVMLYVIAQNPSDQPFQKEAEVIIMC